jgi:hypothetical protein
MLCHFRGCSTFRNSTVYIGPSQWVAALLVGKALPHPDPLPLGEGKSEGERNNRLGPQPRISLK